MAQFKIYGRLEHLRQVHRELGGSSTPPPCGPCTARRQALPRFIARNWQLVAPADSSPAT